MSDNQPPPPTGGIYGPPRLVQEPAPPPPPGHIPLDPQQASAQLAGMWQPRRDWREWHGWAWIAIILILFLLTVAISRLGIDTINAQTTVDPSPSPTVSLNHEASKTTPQGTASPTPSYDLAGYTAALSGSQAQAYASALGKVSKDYRTSNFTTGNTDAGNLIYAANIWLNQLRATNPPPAERGARATYMLAIIAGRKAGSVTQAAVTSTNPLAQLPDGAALTVAALAALKRAASSPAPTGS